MSVVRYRKLPVEVDTVQWTGTNETEVQEFTGGASHFYALDDADRENSDDPEATATVYDRLHSTWVLVYTGQHIVRGVVGEFYPIAEAVLAETYELVTDVSRAESARERLERICGPQIPPELIVDLDAYRAEVLAETAALATPKPPEVSFFGDYGPQVAWWLRMLVGRREKATPDGTTATPTDTNRRARLLHQIADGGRWKSGDVVRWYETQGLTGFGVRAARHDLAILRDSGAITQHDERGVRFYTLREDGRS